MVTHWIPNPGAEVRFLANPLLANVYAEARPRGLATSSPGRLVS